MSDLTTEEELARARSDPAFRQQLLARNLDQLLDALKRMRQGTTRTRTRRAKSVRASISPSRLPIGCAETIWNRMLTGTRMNPPRPSAGVFMYGDE
ncbi:MAG: hypothetical protein ACM3Z4_09850 [Hyphomicrobiales bacterium]